LTTAPPGGAALLKKGLFGLLLLSLLVSSLLSCGERATTQPLPDDALLLAAAGGLLEEGLLLNDLFFVTGIPYLEDGYAAGVYRQADPDFLQARGYDGLSDIRRDLRRVYSSELYELFAETFFSAVAGKSGAASYAYCYEETRPDQTVVLMINTHGLPLQTDRVDYDLTGLQVKEKSAMRALLTAKVTVTNPEGATQQRTKTFALRLEDGVWKLDSYLSLVYWEAP